MLNQFSRFYLINQRQRIGKFLDLRHSIPKKMLKSSTKNCGEIRKISDFNFHILVALYRKTDWKFMSFCLIGFKIDIRFAVIRKETEN